MKKQTQTMHYQTALVQLPLLARETADGKPTNLTTPAEVMAMCADMKDMAQESFHVICVDSRRNVLQRTMTALGLANACLVHPREVFRPAILANAVAVILVHNHPSGDSSPSPEDLRLTRQLVEAGKILDIKVMDHVIIGREPYSMRERGIVSFE